MLDSRFRGNSSLHFKILKKLLYFELSDFKVLEN